MLNEIEKSGESKAESKLDSSIKSICKRYRSGFYRLNHIHTLHIHTLEKRQISDGAAGAIFADDLLDPEINGVHEELTVPQTEIQESAAKPTGGIAIAQDDFVVSSTEDLFAALGDKEAVGEQEDSAEDSESLEAALVEHLEIVELTTDTPAREKSNDPVFGATVKRSNIDFAIGLDLSEGLEPSRFDLSLYEAPNSKIGTELQYH